MANEVQETRSKKRTRLDFRNSGQIEVLQKYTALVHDAVSPMSACWESSLMLRDLLIYHGFKGFEPKVVTVTVHGCDEHCVVLSGGYICDPTAFQFGTGDAWVIVHKDDPQSGYVLGGSPEYQELIDRLQDINGFEIAEENGVVDESEIKALLNKSVIRLGGAL